MSQASPWIDQKTESVNSPVPTETRASASPEPAAASVPCRRPLPGPRGLALARSLWRIRKDFTGEMARSIREYGDVIRFPIGRMQLVLLNHPSHVVHVLQQNVAAYRKSISYQELALVLGQGLVTSEGALWRKQRRLIQPNFRRPELGRFAPLFTTSTQALLEEWRGRDSSQPMDVHVEAMRLTLRIVGHALFSTDLSAESGELGRALDDVLPFVQKRTEALVNIPVSWPLPSHRRYRRAQRSLDKIVDSLIEAHRNAGDNAPRDLLSMLLAVRDPETGEAMDTRQVRDEVMTFLLAGHETTANAVAWTLLLLGQHPDVQSRLLGEIDSVLGDRTPTVEDIPRLDLTRRVLQESMRLYPPAWLIEREALVDDSIDGYHVPKGSVVMLCLYTTHRHPDFWDDPERFDPDRFLADRHQHRSRGAYFPFGAGQRQCIGEGFAMMEMMLVLPMLVRQFRFEPVEGHRIEVDPGVTLRPKHGILMRAVPREARVEAPAGSR